MSRRPQPELVGISRAQYMDALKGDMDNTPLHHSRAGARHMLGNASVAALASDSRPLEIARQVLGAEARPFRATLFDKSPTSNWLVVWHQDTALPLLERHEVLGWGPWSVKEGVIHAHAPATALEQVLALRVRLDESSNQVIEMAHYACFLERT